MQRFTRTIFLSLSLSITLPASSFATKNLRKVASSKSARAFQGKPVKVDLTSRGVTIRPFGNGDYIVGGTGSFDTAATLGYKSFSFVLPLARGLSPFEMVQAMHQSLRAQIAQRPGSPDLFVNLKDYSARHALFGFIEK